jgi:hypothetical protein
MRKIYKIFRTMLFCSILGASINANAQAFTENFDDINTLTTNGWFLQNNSNPLGILGMFQGNPIANGGPFDAFNGAANAYIAANYNSTTGSTGIISNWLITPERTLRNGDVVTFYTRKPTGTDYPDRLELRLSSNGASTNVGAPGNNVGDFTTLLFSLNPTLFTGVYPTSWTQFTITVSGLPAPTSGRIAFRYFVTNAGPSGTNSDYIGIDNVVYTPYVCATITVSPSFLPTGTAGTNYSQSFSQTGALGAPTYYITAGALPPGLTLSPAGAITGIPTATGTFNFTVTAGDASGCTGSHSYSLTILCPTNGASLSVFPSLCSNGPSYILTQGSPAGGYYSGVGVTTGVFDPSVGTQTITYDITDPYGCAQTANQQITVNTAPVVNLSSFSAVCSNSGTATLSGGSPAGGIWLGLNVSGSSFDPSGGSQNITYTYSDGNGCSASDSKNFPVNTAPTVTLNSFTAVCDNSGPFTLSGGSPAGGTWSGVNVSGSSFDPTGGSQLITYSYSDGNGCSASDAKNLPVNTAPAVSLSSFTAVCSNSGSATLSGGSPAGGIWAGVNVSGSSFDPTGGSQLITYTYSDGNGCNASDTKNFPVDTAPVVMATANDSTVCSGDSVIFIGIGALTYNWSNSIVNGAPFSVTTAGPYTVTGIDSNNCSNSDNILITVNTLPTVIAHRSLAAVCLGDSVILYGSGASTYIWNHSVTDSIAFAPSVSLTYNVIGTDLNGCKGSDALVVNVNQLPVVNISTQPTTVCIDASVIVLAATPAGGIWSGPGTSGASFTPSVAGNGVKNIIYTYADSNSCVASDSVFITVNPCSGIEESATDDMIKVYPNPNNGTFFIDLDKGAEIFIYNSLGAVVLSQNMQPGMNTVDIGNYSDGIYMLTILKDGNRKTIRIIKQ